MPDDTGTSPYADYMARLVDGETAQQTSLENRAASLITASGAFTTALFGIATFGHKDLTSLPTASIVISAIGLALLVSSAMCAVLAHQPLRILYVDPHSMLDQLRQYWGESPQTAKIRIAATRARILPAMRLANERKAKFLRLAAASQVCAMLAIAIAIGLIF